MAGNQRLVTLADQIRRPRPSFARSALFFQPGPMGKHLQSYHPKAPDAGDARGETATATTGTLI